MAIEREVELKNEHEFQNVSFATDNSNQAA